MRSQRWAWTHQYAVPMFVASLAALLLAVAALVAFLVFDVGDDADATGDEDALGACLVGSWQLESYHEETSTGNAEMIEGTPAFLFEEDGTGLSDFGATMQVETLGVQETVDVEGQIIYEYETSDGTIEFVNQDSQARMSSDLDFLGIGGNLTLEEGALDASCDGNAMTMTGETTTYEFRR